MPVCVCVSLSFVIILQHSIEVLQCLRRLRPAISQLELRGEKINVIEVGEGRLPTGK